jgi:hypothetical protein
MTKPAAPSKISSDSAVNLARGSNGLRFQIDGPQFHIGAVHQAHGHDNCIRRNIDFTGLVAQITLSMDRALPETDFRRSVRN